MVNLALAHGDLRSLRQQRGLKLRELAQLADVELSELIKCERGLALPSVEFFAKLGSALSIDPRELWTAQQRLSGEPRFGEGYVNARPRSGFVVPRRIELDPSMRPVIDLFCGTGGFSSGFESTGGFQVCAGIDLLSDRVGTFSENHPGAIAYSDDVRNLKPCRLTEESPDPYVIIGGPPCQGFSSIRPFRVLTADDPRNSLFEQFCATVAALQPEWFVFENVVGLLTHKGGSAAREIQNGFESLGYRTSSRVINAAHFGLPQRRERLIMVGNRRGKTLKWPEPTHACEHRSMAGSHGASVSPQGGLFGPKPRPAVTTMEAIGDLPALEAGQAASSYDEGRPASAYAREMREGAVRLTMHDATRHSERMLSIIRIAGSNINALPPGTVSSGFSSCYSRLEPDEPSVTMTVNFVHPASNKCIHPYQDRALTPREGARLQGFPDAYRFIGTRSQVVKQIGNAVPPLLGKVIAEAILASE